MPALTPVNAERPSARISKALSCKQTFIGSRCARWDAWPSWLVRALAIGLRTRAGWRRAGIDTVVSLLEPDEVNELGLGREALLCKSQAVEFISFPIPDRGVPGSLPEAMALIRLISLRISEGKAVAVHCRAGIGRSSLIAACALVYSGASPHEAFEFIEGARRVRVPDTEGQRAWVVDFHEELRRQLKK
jgi:protein-tyrosine phosphatase